MINVEKGEGIADDSTLLLWDLSNSSSKMITPPLPAPLAPPSSSSRVTTSTTTTASNGIMTTKIIKDPIMAYTAPSEINAVAWSFGNTSHGSGHDWVAIGCGRLVRCLR
jgi:WD repeat-containing protein 68